MEILKRKAVTCFIIIRYLFLFIIIAGLFGPLANAAVKNSNDNDKIILEGKRVLYLGDSITQNGMYVSYAQYYLESMFPGKQFDIICIGLSAETASGLSEPNSAYRRPCVFERLDRALEKIKPEIVIACYGMNDGLYHPQSDERFKAYKDGIEKLVTKLKSINAQVILLTPTVFDPLPKKDIVQYENADEYGYRKPFYNYDNVLADYSNFIMNSNFDNVYEIDLHTPMKNYINEKRKSDSAFVFSPDGVHPSNLGHLFMAREFLKGIGIELEHVDLESELKRISSDSLFTLIANYRQTRSKGWLEYIGYTKSGKTVKSDEIGTTEKQINEFRDKINFIKKK